MSIFYSAYKATTATFFGEVSEDQMTRWYNRSCERVKNLAIGTTLLATVGLGLIVGKAAVSYVAGDNACLLLNATSLLTNLSGAEEPTQKAVAALTSLLLGNPKCS